MTRFNGCIDLHEGQVKQIVGGSLSDIAPEGLKTNFVSSQAPAHYARLYKEHSVTRSHVVKLGPKNDEAAKEALAAWPGGLQVGGGITTDNAQQWLDYGAAKVIVTSYLFPNATFSLERLQDLSQRVGRDRLVVDVSCRYRDGRWMVAMDKWQTITDTEVNKETLDALSEHCSEFLIHAADVEGLCNGIDQALVKKLGEWVTIPTTYAGGGRCKADLELVQRLSNGKVDLTFGSALDIFGGNGVTFEECVAWNKCASVLQSSVKILNYGSVNIDEFFSVPHICQSGETLSSSNYIVRAGGKGANQSIALSKAGGNVYHAGIVGGDATWVKDKMQDLGVNMQYTTTLDDQRNGRALIQVSDETGDNCIVLYPGTNALYTADQAKHVLEHFGSGDWIIQQNEISHGGEIMRLASEKGLSIIFNPAPLTKGILDAFPFDKVTILVVNEHEAKDLCTEMGEKSDNSKGAVLASKVLARFPNMQGIIITLGGDGVVAKFRHNNEMRDFTVQSRKVPVKDTTGAGDTFVGFFLSTFVRGKNEDYFYQVEEALHMAVWASSMAVQHEGAMESIPTLDQVNAARATSK